MSATSVILLLSRLFSRLAPYVAVVFLLAVVDILVSGFLESGGLIRRFGGLSPLWIVLGSGSLVIAGLAGSYHLSNRQERRLACQDIVPVAKMIR